MHNQEQLQDEIKKLIILLEPLKEFIKKEYSSFFSNVRVHIKSTKSEIKQTGEKNIVLSSGIEIYYSKVFGFFKNFISKINVELYITLNNFTEEKLLTAPSQQKESNLFYSFATINVVLPTNAGTKKILEGTSPLALAILGGREIAGQYIDKTYRKMLKSHLELDEKMSLKLEEFKKEISRKFKIPLTKIKIQL